MYGVYIGGNHLTSPACVNPPTSHDGYYTVSWDAVENTDHYQLQEQKNGGSWSQVYSGGDRSWQPANAKTDGSYGYEVRACDPCSPWSAEATEQVEIIPPTPGTFQGTPNPVGSDAPYSISWGAVNPAPQYYLLQSNQYGSWQTVYQGSGTSKDFMAPHNESWSSFVYEPILLRSQ